MFIFYPKVNLAFEKPETLALLRHLLPNIQLLLKGIPGEGRIQDHHYSDVVIVPKPMGPRYAEKTWRLISKYFTSVGTVQGSDR